MHHAISAMPGRNSGIEPRLRLWASLLLFILWAAAVFAQGVRLPDGRLVPGPLPPSQTAALPALDTQNNIVYGTAGGQQLKLDFAKPTVCRGQAVPLVVYVHGGAWRSGDKAGGTTRAESRLLLQLGFATASINYRLAPAYTFPAQINDCKLAIRYLRAHAAELGIDPNRIGIYGGSAGGHLVALMGLANDGDGLEGPGLEGVSSAVCAVVDYFGPSDMRLMGDGRSEVNEFLGCTPSACPGIAAQASPVTWADAADPPFLIQHGDQDGVVPYIMSRELAGVLFGKGVPAALIQVKNAGHGFVPTPTGAVIAPSQTEINGKTALHQVRYLEPALYGDLDLDGRVNAVDAVRMALLKGSAGTDAVGSPAPDSWNPQADLASDGAVNDEDEVILRRMLGGD